MYEFSSENLENKFITMEVQPTEEAQLGAKSKNANTTNSNSVEMVSISKKATLINEVPEIDIENDDENPEKEPRISCCYGIMVFVGLAMSLVGLTLVVIYAGFWSNYAMQDHGILLLVGGEIDGTPQSRVSFHILPDAKSRCKVSLTYPLAVTGAVGVVMSKEVTICGGLMKSEPNKKGEVTLNTVPDCYRLDSSGWLKVDELKHSRAFASGVFLPGRGWWITGGISKGDNEVLGLESPLTSTELIPIEDEERGEEYKFLVDEPNLPTESGLSHHCLVRLDKYRVLLIGGQTEGNSYVASVWMFDWKKRKWDQWTDLKYGRHSHSCALALGGEFVVVAGGETEHETVHGSGSQLAEIMEVTTGHWHIMPHLPKPIWGGTFVHVNDLATLVGGAPNEEETHTIQLLEKGEFMENSLKFTPELINEHKRRYAVALVVQEKYVCF